ncbi:E3 ubiquitin ligase BIG BROTHER [Glycine soja]
MSLLSRQIEFKMSWNPCMEVRYNNISYPYSAAGTFIEYVEGLTYEHVNFIFSGASHAQENSYPLTTNFYKSGLSEPESTSYYQDSHGYEVIWEDNVDPDNMTYEELLELGETVGTQSHEQVMCYSDSSSCLDA